MDLRVCLGIVCLLSLAFTSSEAKWVEGNLQSNNNWEFLGRFCFLSSKGSLVYSFMYPVDYGTQEILLYYDAESQWSAVYKTSKNCSSKVSVLKPENHQIIALNTSSTLTSRYSGCRFAQRDGKNWYNCTGSRTFRSMRERWWYVAVARCGKSQGNAVRYVEGMKLEYSMHMTNGEPEDKLTYEFSADEFYILPINIAFLLAYMCLLFVSIVCAVVLRNRQLFHTTYKMYMVAVALWTFHVFLMCIAYGKYSDTGREERGTKVTARVFSSASDIIYLLMLILMAKGFTITRGRLSTSGTIKLTVFVCIYGVVYSVLLVWEANFFDPGLVLYIYESPPGYGLVAMRLIGWVWFLYSIFFTLKNHPAKGAFFYPFFIFFTLWFWAGPIVILIAMHVMKQWTREKTVNGVEQFVSLVGHLFFLILTRPSAANTNFPYHIRTSQIGILTGEEGETDSGQGGVAMGDTDNMGGGFPYATTSSYNGTAPDFSGLFIVSQTHTEKRNGHLPPLAADAKSLPPLGSNLGRNETLPPIQSEQNTPSAPPSYEALFTAKNA
ncbi:transmembrane protein 145-like isoform X1 [Haliotis rufescens]|uniref:transmembrane protein 145-like isoform X1 n=1 Tax=Haliotis rufescens TaxID=6454 RepID=UPI001EB080A9|nr:transmembrane protein 145-like isoform X1 [Haliotis rufescens]